MELWTNTHTHKIKNKENWVKTRSFFFLIILILIVNISKWYQVADRFKDKRRQKNGHSHQPTFKRSMNIEYWKM